MTEAEWLFAPDRLAMVRFVLEKTSDRKLRLYLCAGCRTLWWLLVSTRSRTAVEMAERYVDGAATVDELNSANYWAEVACLPEYSELWNPRGPEICAASLAEHSACVSLLRADPGNTRTSGLSSSAVRKFEDMLAVDWPGAWLVREIFGNPFRPVALNPAWRTSTVLALAQGIYDERAFDRMPILADALQDAGCDTADILTHCRDPQQVHVRGCWVVDLVLGKE